MLLARKETVIYQWKSDCISIVSGIMSIQSYRSYGCFFSCELACMYYKIKVGLHVRMVSGFAFADLVLGQKNRCK